MSDQDGESYIGGMSERGCHCKGTIKGDNAKHSPDLCFVSTQKTVGEEKTFGNRILNQIYDNLELSSKVLFTAPTTEEGWEAEFDAEFRDSFAGGDMWNWERALPIKAFIRKLFADSYKRGREEGEIIKAEWLKKRELDVFDAGRAEGAAARDAELREKIAAIEELTINESWARQVNPVIPKKSVLALLQTKDTPQ